MFLLVVLNLKGHLALLLRLIQTSGTGIEKQLQGVTGFQVLLPSQLTPHLLTGYQSIPIREEEHAVSSAL